MKIIKDKLHSKIGLINPLEVAIEKFFDQKLS